MIHTFLFEKGYEPVRIFEQKSMYQNRQNATFFVIIFLFFDKKFNLFFYNISFYYFTRNLWLYFFHKTLFDSQQNCYNLRNISCVSLFLSFKKHRKLMSVLHSMIKSKHKKVFSTKIWYEIFSIIITIFFSV